MFEIRIKCIYALFVGVFIYCRVFFQLSCHIHKLCFVSRKISEMKMKIKIKFSKAVALMANLHLKLKKKLQLLENLQANFSARVLLQHIHSKCNGENKFWNTFAAKNVCQSLFLLIDNLPILQRMHLKTFKMGYKICFCRFTLTLTFDYTFHFLEFRFHAEFFAHTMCWRINPHLGKTCVDKCAGS